jgi:hypothetical protein
MLTISSVLCSSLLLMQLAGPPGQPGIAQDLRANQLFKDPGIGAEAPAFQPAPEEERRVALAKALPLFDCRHGRLQDR